MLIGGVAELGSDRFCPDLIETLHAPGGEFLAAITNAPTAYLARVAIGWDSSDGFGSCTEPWLRERIFVGRHELER
jgi:hypothetical protein